MKRTAMFTAIAAALEFVVLLATNNNTHALVIAADSAADPAYAFEADGAWKGENPGTNEGVPGNDNGGFGFLPWDFSGGFSAGGAPYGQLNHFIDGVDFPTTNFNDLGAPAFALGNEPLAFFGITAVARRPFAQTLQVGDVFSADFDTPAEYDDHSTFGFPFAIIGFEDEAGTNTLNIEAGSSVPYGDFPWRYTDANVMNGDFGMAAGGSPIAPTATSDGSTINLEILSATTGRVTLDGTPLEISFKAGLPKSVVFTLFDNNGEADDMGNPTGEHAFYFDNLMIETATGGLPGDYNENDMLDAADYTVWRDNLGATMALPNEGPDTPGMVTTADYDFWKTNFGNRAAAGGSPALSTTGEPPVSTAAVPEPAPSILLILGVAVVFASRGTQTRPCSRR